MSQVTIRKQSYGGKDMENNGHGVSAFENEQVVRAAVVSVKHKKILDVGAGAGYYGRILSDLHAKIDAVEIWPESVEHLKQSGWYSWVAELDIRDYKYEDGIYDIVIFGDILEHLSLEDALAVFNYAIEHAHTVIVSIPNSNYPQEALYGNDHERHLIEDPVIELIPLLQYPVEVHEFKATNTYIYSRVV